MSLLASQRCFLEKVLETNSPSGNERQLISLLYNEMKDICHVKTDCIGNLYMTPFPKVTDNLNGTIMISAHADEVGFQISEIDVNGYAYIRSVAGIDIQTLAGSKVCIVKPNCTIIGVIGKKPPHLLEWKEREKVLGVNDVWVDFGFQSKEEAEQFIECGDYLTLSSNITYTCNNKRIISKALDNKVGVFILVEVIRRLSESNLPVPVVGVATVQEELGCRGSIVAAKVVNPSVAFCIDVGIATDIPDLAKSHMNSFALGKGVGIIANADNNELLVNSLIQTANDNSIQYQRIIGHRATGGTEASHIQLASRGTATANISIPNRYMHSLVEMCDLDDIESAISLLCAEVIAINNLREPNFSLFAE